MSKRLANGLNLSLQHISLHYICLFSHYDIDIEIIDHTNFIGDRNSTNGMNRGHNVDGYCDYCNYFKHVMLIINCF